MPTTYASNEAAQVLSSSEMSNETTLIQKVVEPVAEPAPIHGGISFHLKQVQFNMPVIMEARILCDAELTAKMSEEALSRIWDTPEEDEAWQHLQEGT